MIPTHKRCFVIMPYGQKPIPGPGDQTYDFDKVYRAAITPAVESAGLSPIRADEPDRPAVLHIEMFRALRDDPVVVADLSLANPNVFYELGVRHTMVPAGTVLMCRDGTELPFDVGLSRVIKYRYDGKTLDVEESQEIQRRLKNALKECVQQKSGHVDSPVHALLESVSPAWMHAGVPPVDSPSTPAQHDSLIEYQSIVAESWFSGSVDDVDQRIGDLLEAHKHSAFGVGALARYCLRATDPPSSIKTLIKPLVFLEQYPLVVEIYERLEKLSMLSSREFARYGSAVSEVDPTPSGAQRAMELSVRGLNLVKASTKSERDNTESLLDIAYCHFYAGNLATWWWQMTGSDEQLSDALTHLDSAVKTWNLIWDRLEPADQPVYLASRAHARLLLLRRAQADDINRPDEEGHAKAVLKLTQPANTRLASWLHWYQTFILVDQQKALPPDSPEEKKLITRAYRQYATDVQLMEQGKPDIARRQYRVLRRFIEKNAAYLRNPRTLGRICHLLQANSESI